MRIVKIVLMLVLVVIISLLSLQNTTEVQAHFLWYTTKLPLIILLLITAFSGLILGLLITVYLMVGFKGKQKKLNQARAEAGKTSESGTEV